MDMLQEETCENLCRSGHLSMPGATMLLLMQNCEMLIPLNIN